MRPDLRILLVGDDGVGKSSLISQLIKETFSPTVQHVLPEVSIPPEVTPENVTTYIVDSSARPENRDRLEFEIRRANVICIVYAIDNPDSCRRVDRFWIPFIRSVGVNVPLVLVANKLDLRTDGNDFASLEDIILPIMERHREVETGLECSAYAATNVSEVFYLAQKAVLHPTSPLYDPNIHELKPACREALCRIFKLCDSDKDGILNDEDLDEFQRKCFNLPLQQQELEGVKAAVRENEPSGMLNDGLTDTGFLYLHKLFVQRGRLETTWTVLRKFGYGDDLHLRRDFLCPAMEVPQESSVELSFDGYQFFTELFQSFDRDRDSALSPQELSELFSTAPQNPWLGAEQTTVTNENGNITLQGFLARWSMMTLIDYKSTLAYLAYLGFENDRRNALQVITPRRVERKRGRVQRSTFLCYVLGAAGSGKTSLLRKFIGKPFQEEYRHTPNIYSVVNSVELRSADKYLVMQEIGSRLEGEVLSSRKGLEMCDLLLFVYDSSDPNSFSYVSNLITRYKLLSYPCVLVASKTDLEPAQQRHDVQPEVFCRSLGIDEPIRVSVREDRQMVLYPYLLKTIVNPQSAIPRLKAQREGQTLKAVLMTSAVLVTIFAVGFSLWRIYRGQDLVSSSSGGSGGPSGAPSNAGTSTPGAGLKAIRRARSGGSPG